MQPSPPFVIGTRGSPLALAQANETRARLAAALGLADDGIHIQTIRTTGDAITDRPLSEAGGKGLFTKEIDAAQLVGRVDIAVHSAKDLPTALPDGLIIAGYLPREDARDAFIAAGGLKLADLPAGAIIGTASLRRQAQVLRYRPDLTCQLLRGNVGTRLAKLEAGEMHGTLLALAGLKRLGLSHHASEILDPVRFCPAVGQGAIALVARADDARTHEAIGAIACHATNVALACERAYLAVLDGSCRTPISGHAVIDGDRLSFHGQVFSPDGREGIEISREGTIADMVRIGEDAGHEARARAPAGIFPA